MADNIAQPGPAAAPPLPQGAGAGAATGQPPFGSSPVSQPVPNRGHEAAAMSRLGIIVKLMEETIPLLGSGSEPGKDLIGCLNKLAKHVPPGAVSPGIQQATMEKLMAQQKQMGPQIAAMRAMSQQPAGAGAGAPPPAAPPTA